MAKLTGAPEIDLAVKAWCPFHKREAFFLPAKEALGLHCPNCDRPMRTVSNRENEQTRKD